MSEFLDIIFSGANAVPTALLLFVILYWMIVMIGLLDTEFLDFDIDIDGDADVDVDAAGGNSSDISWINNALVFFNLGKIPLMIWLSFLALPLWLICVYVNGFLGISNFFLGLLIFVPSLIVSLFVAKFLTWPFVSFFAKIDQDSKPKEITGRIGTVILPADDQSKGQAEINYDGSFLRFSILSRKGTQVSKGQKVLFIQRLGDEGTYLIEPYDENQ